MRQERGLFEAPEGSEAAVKRAFGDVAVVTASEMARGGA